jgi:hypothetical protein
MNGSNGDRRLQQAIRIAKMIDALPPNARRAFCHMIVLVGQQKKDPTEERAEIIEEMALDFQCGIVPELPESPTLH